MFSLCVTLGFLVCSQHRHSSSLETPQLIHNRGPPQETGDIWLKSKPSSFSTRNPLQNHLCVFFRTGSGIPCPSPPDLPLSVTTTTTASSTTVRLPLDRVAVLEQRDSAVKVNDEQHRQTKDSSQHKALMCLRFYFSGSLSWSAQRRRVQTTTSEDDWVNFRAGTNTGHSRSTLHSNKWTVISSNVQNVFE